ncbi:MAG: hypothetical protein DMG30_03355 [Acidobacteria bacterium]|nr:MAG: hypothetical protein DMG30_03355 [Acidobacteriota bacterium]
MRHDHALFGGLRPVGNEKFALFGIIESGDLFGEQREQLLIEGIAFGNQAQRLQSFLVCVALRIIFIFAHLAEQKLPNFLTRTHTLFQRFLNRHREDLTHLGQDLVGSLQELRVGRARSLRLIAGPVLLPCPARQGRRGEQAQSGYESSRFLHRYLDRLTEARPLA